VARRESDDGDVRIDLRDESDAFEITVHLPDEQWKADVSVSASAVRVRARPDNPSTEESHDPSTQESENPSTRKSDAVERRVALTRGIAVERAMMVRSDATLTIVLPTVSA
jgi:HSP20 family molecular chaperone IbpA